MNVAAYEGDFHKSVVLIETKVLELVGQFFEKTGKMEKKNQKYGSNIIPQVFEGCRQKKVR